MQLWFCEIRENTVGPVTLEQLSALAGTGEVTPATRVRKSEEEDWSTASEIVGLFDESLGEALAGSIDEEEMKARNVCPECGRRVNPVHRRCQYCGYIEPSEDEQTEESEGDKGELEGKQDSGKNERAPIQSLGHFYASPFMRTGSFLTRLDWFDTAKKLAYLVGGLTAITFLLFVIDALTGTPLSISFIALVIVVCGFGIGLLLNGFVEWLLIGVGLAIVRHPYPQPEVALRAIGEVVLAKLMIALLFSLGSFFLLPIFFEAGMLINREGQLSIIWLTVNGMQVALCFLVSVSIYTQRFSMPRTKAAILSLLSTLLLATVWGGFLFLRYLNGG